MSKENPCRCLGQTGRPLPTVAKRSEQEVAAADLGNPNHPFGSHADAQGTYHCFVLCNWFGLFMLAKQ
jgi:hypothetical protein